jgi:hypothetical protein
MNESVAEHRVVRVDPLDCLRTSWKAVKPSYWLFFGICAAGMLIGSAAPLGILIGPMLCGIYLCYLRLLRGEPVEFALLFRGFDHFVPSLIATLIPIGIGLVFMVPLGIIFFAMVTVAAGQQGGDAAQGIMLPVMLLLVLCVFLLLFMMGIFLLFSYQLIVDRGLSGWEAVKSSANAAWANLQGVLGLAILNALLALVGGCFCYIGLFFLMPIQFGAIVVAYRKVFPDGAPLAIPPLPMA